MKFLSGGYIKHKTHLRCSNDKWAFLLSTRNGVSVNIYCKL